MVTLSNSIKAKSTQNTKNANLGYSSWIGASWREDAKQTINALNKKKIDWLVIDHYGIDRRGEEKHY